MEAVIWSKETAKGAVETDGQFMFIAGEKVCHATKSTELPRSSQILKDGKLFTHHVGGKIALTRDEADAFDAAYFAHLNCKSQTPEAVVRRERVEYLDSLTDLSRDMSKENSRW